MTPYQRQLDEFMRGLGFELVQIYVGGFYLYRDETGRIFRRGQAAFMYNLTIAARKDEAYYWKDNVIPAVRGEQFNREIANRSAELDRLLEEGKQR